MLRRGCVWKIVLITGLGIMIDGTNPGQAQAQTEDYANRYDQARAKVLADREADWRNGAVVYQVLVDRFAPSANLDAKRDRYAPPRTLRDWSDTPKQGEYVPDAEVWSHELDFWGGDLASVMDKLDYIQGLGVDVLYLNPIHAALTNHKYDARDYFEVSPEYGTRDDVKRLADALHQRGMKLVLDGVFNHVGRTSDWFQQALSDEQNPYRDWFYFDASYENGYIGWANVANLPELRMENPAVRARIFGDADSVVQGYLRDGVDGWRLDVAPELGFRYLSQLTQAAHGAKADALVIGENWVYPEEWMPALDAVMNLFYLRIFEHLMNGNVSGAHAAKMIDRMIEDTGLDAVLKSWVILDNHDLPRIGTVWPESWRRRMAQVLQFTLPGSPCVYYGVEVGLKGGEDPEQRGPMRWDLANDDNPEFVWMGQLLEMRRSNRALAIGDFRLLDTEDLLAFVRRTDRVMETTIVIANPTDQPVSEVFSVRDSKLMNGSVMRDELSDARARVECGLIVAEVPARTIWVLRPESQPDDQYNPYKRVQ